MILATWDSEAQIYSYILIFLIALLLLLINSVRINKVRYERLQQKCKYKISRRSFRCGGALFREITNRIEAMDSVVLIGFFMSEGNAYMTVEMNEVDYQNVIREFGNEVSIENLEIEQKPF